MRIPLLDFEMALDGLVVAHDDGSIELLPCPLTDLISKREGLIFDAFDICLSEYDALDALLCAYSYGDDIEDTTRYIVYDILLSEIERQTLFDIVI